MVRKPKSRPVWLVWDQSSTGHIRLRAVDTVQWLANLHRQAAETDRSTG